MKMTNDLIRTMRKMAPPGQSNLDSATLQELCNLTQKLRNVRPAADEEHARFLALPHRSIPVSQTALDSWLGDATVLVTGGTGCIGSALTSQITRCHPRQLVSIGITNECAQPEVRYIHEDIRDYRALSDVFTEVKPDVVFHVAAQRNPGLAEKYVFDTVSTNVFGTQNVVRAVEEHDVPQMVHASTGKVVRPYTSDIYAASKRVAEWMISRTAEYSLTTYSAARFTHVADNSLIYQKLRDWSMSGVIRLHAPDIVFYAQSALESAQLLLTAGLTAHDADFMVYAINDLDWPFDLLDLTLGTLNYMGSNTPIYFSGYDPGYEEESFPGLYDPMTAGGVSPLLNIFEAAIVKQYETVDVFPSKYAENEGADRALSMLRDACYTGKDKVIREKLDILSWCLLDSILSTTSHDRLVRMAELTVPFEAHLCPAYQKILATVWACA
jgi:nucleoside-diphosphate-sugar epimerase